jgi:hypothetical protein
VLSTAYSLFVVGFSSMVGAAQNMRKGLVSYKTALVFSIPSFIAVYLTRRYLVPAIPQELFTVGDFLVTKDIALMVFFAVVMLMASFAMIRPRNCVNCDEEVEQAFNYPLILLEGAVVGVVTGIVGAGGGFLIIPALVLLAKLPMKMAVGTSLLIIAAKSMGGFIGDLGAEQPIDWHFLLIFSGLAAVGIFLGSYLSTFIPGAKLRKSFGWFVLIMGIYILSKEIFF